MKRREHYVDLDFARVDSSRRERTGFPEVIFCEGKTPDQVGKIAREIATRDGLVLGTRANAEHFAAVSEYFPEAEYHPVARAFRVVQRPMALQSGVIGVVCAGTTDLPVAEEAAFTLTTFGNPVERITDIGVAGLHRVIAVREQLAACRVLIVVAGMEGALPSVIAGLVGRPVIAVPTSVGYGVAFGGFAALLGMLNSCGSGVTVVNIDNGFGAAFAAALINRE